MKKNRSLQFFKWFLAVSTILIPFALFIFFSKLVDGQSAGIISSILIIFNLPLIFVLCSRNFKNIDSSFLNSYFTLVILNASVFPLYVVVKEYKENTQREVDYTVGFRSWATKVEISDIDVIYFDEYDNPFKVFDDSLEYYKKENWKGPLWKFKDQPDSLMKFEIPTDSNKIILRSCGITLKKEIFRGKNIRNFKVTATFKFIGCDSTFIEKYMKSKNDSTSESDKYFSSQICLMSPVYKDDNYKWENYLAFEFFYYNFSWSKLRIPVLNYDFYTESLFYRMKHDSIAKKHYHDIIINKLYPEKFDLSKEIKIRLSAMIYDNHCFFKILKTNDTDSAPLFDFMISDDRTFSFPLEHKSK
jgi:hypothetical protein